MPPHSAPNGHRHARSSSSTRAAKEEQPLLPPPVEVSMQQSYGAAAAGKSPCLAAVRKLSDISPTLLELPLSSVVPVSTYVCFCFCNEHAERVCPSFLSLQFPPLHLRSLVSLAIPSVLGALLSVVINIVNLSFVGHLSPELLGGAALGNALMLITGQCVLLGLCSAIDTLCAQAHGAGQTQLVGLIAQRACVAFTLVVLPILAVWSRTEQLLLLAAQEPRIAAPAGEYVWYCLPTIFPILYSEIIKRYLQAQSIITPQIYVALVSNCVHAAAAYLLMFHFNMGLRGAAVGLAIGLTTNLLCWLMYLLFFNRRVARRTCPRINLRDLFSNWMPLWKYGIPGFMMMFAEWASFELCAVAAGWLGAVQLDTLIVFSNICTFLTMAPSGIAISTSTLVGHAIGAGHASQARMYAHASCCLILLFALFEFLCLELLRHELVRVFTTDPAVNEAFKHISMCVALFVLFDCYQNVEGGVLRGLGYQSFGAKVNGAVFYLLGLPLGFLLTFHFDFGVAGLVIGLVTSVAAQTVVFFLKLQRIDWSHEVLLAQQRIADERTHSPLLSLRSNSITSTGEEDDDDPDEEEQKSTPR